LIPSEARNKVPKGVLIPSAARKKVPKGVLILLAILVLASFFRLWKLNQIPPGLYPDIAINGNDALDTLASGKFKVFYPENNGREGLFMWLISISFLVFGPSVWAIKIVAAAVGILTVFGLYLFTKELFKIDERSWLAVSPDAAALLASFFLATSFWHTNFSRIGFRAILVPFILVFSFYFLLRGFREKRLWQFILAGIIFGLGFYTYIGFRFAVLILPFIFLPFYCRYKNLGLKKQFLLFTAIFFTAVFLTVLPIGIYFLRHLRAFTGRASDVSVFSQKSPLKALLLSLLAHLAMFVVYGDANWRHNLPTLPMLPFGVAVLFMLGLILTLKDFLQKISNWKNSRVKSKEALRPNEICFSLTAPLILLSWFISQLLPGILTAEGIPHALRTLGVIPVAYIFASLAGIKTYFWLKENTRRQKLFFSAVAMFLLMVAVVQFGEYFINWANAKGINDAFSANYLEIGNYLNSLPESVKMYVIVNRDEIRVPYPDGLPMPAQSAIFIERIKFGQPRATYIESKNIDQIKISGRTVIVPLQEDKKLFQDLAVIFPGGQIKKSCRILIYEID